MLEQGHCLSAVALSFIAATVAAQPASDPADRYPVAYADVAGTKLAYIEAGRGVPVILVHGALSDYRYWEPQLAGGPDGVRVIAYSRRDFYPNARDSGAELQTPDRDVEDLIELIEALDLAPVHLVGHSAGGHAALVAAIRRPDLVRSLVLEEGGFVTDHPASAQAIARIQPVFERVMEHSVAGEREAAVRHFIDFVSGEGSFDSASAPIRQMMLDNEPTMRLRDNAPLTCDEVKSVALPVLMVLGERSPPYVGQLLAGVRECLGTEETITIPAASHGIHYEQPEAFNRAVYGFIAAH